jgi:cytosine/adenosine deaminase-related metal-dependent hydrolase
MTKVWNFRKLLIEEIEKKGGWTNCHVHADRAFTINPDKLDIYKEHDLVEKWDIVDEVKDASVDEYYRRISDALEVMIEQGVKVVGSFIDVDPIAEDRAIKGAIKAKESYKDDINLITINQTLKGVIDREARRWFDMGAEMADIIGGLPRRDELEYGKGKEHFDILMKAGKKHNKRVHIHIDQFNTPEDKETELLAEKAMEHDMEGMVSAVHCISVAAHDKDYRKEVYKKLKKAEVSVIACPTAWIDSPRKEKKMPFHNSLTPVDELVENGITVALGTDNICDYMVPFCDGDMYSDLKLLATGNRFLEIDELVKIATINGRKVLGLED